MRVGTWILKMSAPWRRAPLAGLLHVVEMDVVDPLAVERDHRVSDRALAAGDEQLFLAVGMRHQVGARLDGDGAEKSV